VPVYEIEDITRAQLDDLLASGVSGTFYGPYFVVGFLGFEGGTAYRVTG
jgi:hypothetical protein